MFAYQTVDDRHQDLLSIFSQNHATKARNLPQGISNMRGELVAANKIGCGNMDCPKEATGTELATVHANKSAPHLRRLKLFKDNFLERLSFILL